MADLVLIADPQLTLGHSIELYGVAATHPPLLVPILRAALEQAETDLAQWMRDHDA